MNKHNSLLSLRLKLDDAITYGSRQSALRIARAALQEAIAQNLEGEIEYFKGQIALLRENYVSAIEHFDSAIRYNPADGASYNDRALCMVELGIIDEALRYFNKGIAVESDYATIYHNKGWLLNNIGRHREAIACFKKALSLEPKRAVTYDNLADALYNLGDYKGALDAYNKVLELLKPGVCRNIRKSIISQIKCITQKIGG